MSLTVTLNLLTLVNKYTVLMDTTWSVFLQHVSKLTNRASVSQTVSVHQFTLIHTLSATAPFITVDRRANYRLKEQLYYGSQEVKDGGSCECLCTLMAGVAVSW